MRVGFHTLGCKLNQSETEAVADAFRRAGHDPLGLDDEADLYIVNTCTVTSKSEQKARRLLRKILGEHPGRPVVVMGCYAEMEKRRVEELGDGVFAVGLGDMAGLPEALALRGFPASPARDANAVFGSRDGESFASGAEASGDDSLPSRIRAWLGGKADPAREEVRFRFHPSRYSFHTRAFLKIQDGCDNRCSYCRVRLARGPSLSLDAGEALDRFRRLEEAGHGEIVLTGINLSSYRSRGLDLGGLLREILSGGGGARIRLSSLEPEAVTENLAEALRHPRICPHFHLAVQSGSDPVLRAMRRRYNRLTVCQAVARLRGAAPHPFIAADLIVGFPGETPEDHGETVAMVRDLRFADLHVFPFSPRPGTEAAGMAGRVPERLVRERAAELRSLAEQGLFRYGTETVGSVLDVMVERCDLPGGGWEGAAENYLTVRGGPGGEGLPAQGSRIPVRITDFRDGFAWGRADE